MDAVQALPLSGRSYTGPSAGGVIGGTFSAGARAGVAPIAGVPPPPPFDYQRATTGSLKPGATTAAFDDFFEYSLTDPITIRKNESALVPILQTRLPVERVTLWSPQQPIALRALWITDSSRLTLDRGSFTIVENGNFGGEGLLDPIHPGERRLLSYAADQAVHVSVDYSHLTRRVTRLTIQGGVLTEASTDIAEVEYLVHNAAPEPRTVIVEQPVRAGWTLDSEAKPSETTATAYRFRVGTKAGESVRLHIGERHTNFERFRLVDRTEDTLNVVLTNAHASAAARAKLEPVFAAHHAVVALDEQIRNRQGQIADITTDQNRLRQNLAALKGTPEEKALARRYTGELNAQEDRLTSLHQQVETLKAQREAADADFKAKLEAVDFDEMM